MKLLIPAVALALGLAAAHWSGASEPLTFKTLSGQEYVKATPAKVEPDGVTFETDAGLEKIPFAELPENLRVQFGYKPDAAAAHARLLAAQKAATAQFIAREETGAARAKVERNREAAALAGGGDSVRAENGVASNKKGQVYAENIPKGNEGAGTGALPPPVEGHTFDLREIREARALLAGKVVWVRLATRNKTEPPVKEGDAYRVAVAEPGQDGEVADVYFPAEGAQKMDLLGRTAHDHLSFFLKVTETRLEAVGRSKHTDSFKGTFAYTW